ncbi:MAG: hypothetical protein NT131_03460 [Methanomassiliicoccales archaeon]|nr:hypothetical protein [Methanomassiliicoccales archaeon]
MARISDLFFISHTLGFVGHLPDVRGDFPDMRNAVFCPGAPHRTE